MTSKEQPKVSSALDFKKRTEQNDQGQIIELTSGLVVRAKRPSVSHLVNAGIIPASLAGAQFRVTTAHSPADRKDADIQRTLQLQVLLAKEALIEPRVVKNPNYENGEIAETDLREEDLTEIYTFIMGGLEALDRFRGVGEGVLTRPDSEAVSGDEA